MTTRVLVVIMEMIVESKMRKKESSDSFVAVHLSKDPISRGRHTLIILPFIYCDMILDRNDPLPRVIRQTSGSFKIRIN